VILDEQKPPALPDEPLRFFQKTDLWSFGGTTLLVFMVYLFTLAPEVTLGHAGVYITDAMYPGPSIPPGNPVWAIYGWLFTKLVPFSNVAWRVNLSSAVAGALTCGLIALIVSRVGFMAVENLPSCRNLTPREQSFLRAVCGGVAGLGFGLDAGFWPKAVVADPWPLSLLLFSLALCLLTRWFFMPTKKFPLYLATFISGLTAAEYPSLTPAILGLLLTVAMTGRQLGRDVLVFVTICLWVLLWWPSPVFSNLCSPYEYGHMPMVAAILTTLSGAGLCWVRRNVFSEWKTLSVGIILVLAGLSSVFLSPVYSMTDPPINWDYPRTVEGVFHSMSRGIYGYSGPGTDFQITMQGVGIFLKIVWSNLGPIYLFAGATPLFALRKTASPARRWLIVFLSVCFFTSLLMILIRNPAGYVPDVESNETYFTVVRLLLAVIAGCGFMQIGVAFGKPVPNQLPEQMFNE
jgi:Protein of unknown function (DUF2723)